MKVDSIWSKFLTILYAALRVLTGRLRRNGQSSHDGGLCVYVDEVWWKSGGVGEVADENCSREVAVWKGAIMK